MAGLSLYRHIKDIEGLHNGLNCSYKKSKSLLARKLIFRWLFFAVILWNPAGWAVEHVIEFSIPPSNADAALNLLANQADVQLMYPYSIAKNVKVKGLSGAYTAREGVEKLLRDTCLGIGFHADGTIQNNVIKGIAIMKLSDCKKVGILTALSAALATMLTPSTVSAQEDQLTRSGMLEEIVVVARRTEERLQDVPITVTAISGDLIRRASISNATDLIKVVPTLSVAQSSQGPGQGYALRGVRSGVVTYFNEVPTATVAVDDQIWDLDSVQALSGPQGTLFGRNSTGGAVLFIPHKPIDEVEGFIDAEVGNYNQRKITAVLNTPITDSLSVRVGARTVRRDGVVKNSLGPDLQSQDRNAYRASVLFEPNEIVTNYLVLDYAERDETPFGLVTSNVTPNAGCFPGLGCFYGSELAELGELQDRLGRRRIASQYPASQETRQWGVSNIITLQPSDQISIKYILGVRNDEFDQFKSQTSINLPAQIGLNSQEGKSNTHELQVITDFFDNKLNWTNGFFYSKADSDAISSYLLFGTVGLPFDNDSNVFTSSSNQRKSRAIYSQATYAFTENVNLTVGLRYTEEEASLDLSSVGPQFTFVGPQVCRLPNGPDVDSINCFRSLSDRYNATTYNLSIDYRVSSDFLLYGTMRRGFNAGGFNSSAPRDVQPGSPRPSYGPEEINDYELGFKADWFVGSMLVRTNLGLFYAKYRDIQRGAVGISDEGVPFQGVTTGPKATIYGGQLETLIRPVDNFLLQLNYGYLNTGYDEAIDGFSKGNNFSQSPENTVNILANYIYPVSVGGEFSATASYTYQSSISFADVTENKSYAFQGSYGLVDFRLDWNDVAGKRFDIGFYVKNATDKAYALERNDLISAFGFVSSVYNDPRTYGINFRFRFGD